MMKFASFETIVEMIYHRLPGSKDDYSKATQTGVSFVGGYLAGILCAIVSHPADVMVSKLNAYPKGTGVGKIYKDIGFSGLWNGLPVRIVMIGTLTGLQWMIYVSPVLCRSCTRRLLLMPGNRTTSRSSWASQPLAALLQSRRRSKYLGGSKVGVGRVTHIWLLLAACGAVVHSDFVELCNHVPELFPWR